MERITACGSLPGDREAAALVRFFRILIRFFQLMVTERSDNGGQVKVEDRVEEQQDHRGWERPGRSSQDQGYEQQQKQRHRQPGFVEHPRDAGGAHDCTDEPLRLGGQKGNGLFPVRLEQEPEIENHLGHPGIDSIGYRLLSVP